MLHPRSALFVLALALPASSADVLVPGDHPTIQAAIVAAAPGDTVRVAPGTWVEALDFLGKPIEVTSTGGSALTILKAPMGAGAVVTFASGEGPTSRLIGFRIVENDNLDFAPLIDIQGASPTLSGLELTKMEAFAIDVTDGTPFIVDCRLHHGHSFSGAGIRLRRSDPTLLRCAIHDLAHDGVLTKEDSSPTLRHTVVRDCGVGLHVTSDLPPGTPDGSHPLVEASVFARNYHDFANGSAIHVGPGLSLTVRDSLLLDHPVRTVDAAGDPLVATEQLILERNRIFVDSAWTFAVSASHVDTVVLRDNAFGLDPSASQAGGGYSVLGATAATLEGNTVAGFQVATQVGSTPSPLHQGGLFAFQPPGLAFYGTGPESSAVTNAIGAGSSCVQITDPDFVDRAGRDLHLRAGSVCIDGAAKTTSPVDLDGDPRVAPFDYGADEVQPVSLWTAGDPLSGGVMRVVLQGPPGAPCFLGVAASKLPLPIPTAFGDYQLGPGVLLMNLGPIGADGLRQLSFPSLVTPTPAVLYGQALVGLQLTGVVEVVLGG